MLERDLALLHGLIILHKYRNYHVEEGAYIEESRDRAFEEVCGMQGLLVFEFVCEK